MIVRSKAGPTARYDFVSLALSVPYSFITKAFERHIDAFHHSDEFKQKAQDAKPFFKVIADYIFGRPATLENIVSIHPFLHRCSQPDAVVR
jgi:hypothetical protein